MTRPMVIAIAGVLIVGFAFILNFQLWHDDVGPPEPVTTAEPAKPAKPTPAPAQPDKPEDLPEQSVSTPSVKAPEPTPKLPAVKAPVLAPEPVGPRPPSFDVARVNPQGEAVIAGRAEPDSRVVIMDGNKELGHVTADRRGEWVFVPDKRLKPGPHQLKLRMEIKDSKPMFSASNVVVVVPAPNKNIAGETTKKKSGTLAFKVPSKGRGPVTVLQTPAEEADPKAPSGGTGKNWIVVDAVDYDDSGQLSISGHAEPGAPVNVYLSNKFLGRTITDKKGVWQISPTEPIEPGLYRLRADRVQTDGKVLARVEFPFERAKPITDLKEGTFIIVQPGNSLWRLARRTYGSGFAYTVIFEANQEQIADPNLIHPGQVFALPNAQ
ncbi:MAG: LysM peptidoglycan-binding domain-containing protein [Rhodospirillaceae bacterium]|jgi:nucleoid-associated protein YgaU|nr:LysM peptidoglycan-binding domain-containing protein [Rhodospirillales bacterium]MBT3904846.1 LysM peptidoglycan-binding domain-containing protein [Rhodospirillaceae bacterium]MBT4702819.1 LysM peptidoglycan-binding domain-containing protein [Rhodospirillaceae bacterium]MBT5036346.1 LysM peptidoglycan-binding domain-containing protein [Rhodospirillaceae bacterium]MBT6222248.1 LysM peptidoglycan-binding domain-containing protein [Rhodospirillaceae bacterium]